MKHLCITSKPEELEQGLFGQVFYHIFQVLPYLYEKGIYPAWELHTMHYGDPPGFLTLPGALDLAYVPPTGPYRNISLGELRRRHAHVLGNDWEKLRHIWNAYFAIPERVLLRADAIFPEGRRVLGIHYRGTDKQTAGWDTNAISQAQYIALLKDFLSARRDFDTIVAATDEFSFVQDLRSSVDLPIISLGEVEFHMATEGSVPRAEKTDRALLDCILLSRCDCLIETSSALPSFAKLFNPRLEIYRCAASKLFGKLYTNMPYFPVAHIPILPVTDAESKAILDLTLKSDWTLEAATKKYQRPFSAEPRWPINHKVFSFAEKLSLERPMAKLVSGYH